ncbi:Retrovirus-related Pol polyprotein from transposon 17.6 [Eumeta japonica]|uniref:Retrovirus-related Pol polyprotein from transposon 17.6 n=1 Tax=Eumeta variegata TaxID=151549 RepID=A0A4C1TC56_EUMVA|nr:Retrovirus-related Pol polyprotein from transposon 17.6 [Eumeta japonica]
MHTVRTIRRVTEALNLIRRTTRGLERTKATTDIRVRTYRYPQVHRDEVNRQIREMLDQNIICHSQSPYNAPIWVVPKKLDSTGKQNGASLSTTGS